VFPNTSGEKSVSGNHARVRVLSEPDKRLVPVGLAVIFDSDQLDDFAPEPESPSGHPAARLVSLDEVVSRGITVHWDEAVAVIEDLCELLVSNGKELPVPALQDVLIGAGGVVTFRHPGRGEKGPVEAGRALHTLLSTAEIPVALRLFVTQATAPETHASIREFAEALSYFGKPTRQELVRAIYDRCVAVAGVAAAPTPPSLPRVRDPKASRTPQTPGGVPLVQRRRPKWFVPVAVTACLLGVAGLLWSSGVASGTSEEESPSLLSHTKDVIADVSVGVREVLGTGDVAPTSQKPAAVAQQQATVARPIRAPRATARPSRPSVASVAASAPVELPRLPAAAEPPALSALPIPQAMLQAPTAREDVPAAREATPTLYSSEDADVSPPVLLFPQLPAPLMIGSSAGPVNRMEIVVSADGAVERVRLVNGPTRMPDMMLLSGAKLWRFTPAVKGGEPVRYRTVVTWSGFP